MNVHVFNTILEVSADDAAQHMLSRSTTLYLNNELFSYSWENTLPVNKMSQNESQIKSYYELSI